MRKKNLKIFTVIVLVLLFSWIYLLREPIVNDAQGIKYTVPQGATISDVVNDLTLLHIVQHPLFFNLLVYLRHNRHQLKAGEYFFPEGTTAPSLLTQITTGRGMIYHAFIIVPGWTFKQIRDALAKNPNVLHAAEKLSDTDIMKRLGHPEISFEAAFYPDTFYFAKGTFDLTLLRRAFVKMQNKLVQVWPTRDTDLPYQTINQALTVASLVEKETKLNNERPVIAGVIINRLNKNMLLQIDPTVIYALGNNYSGRLHKSDLLVKNPYNTYLNKGLPPSPIAIPSMESLNAALHPQKNDYYYYVAKSGNLNDGHQFSKTLTEHYRAVDAAKQKMPTAFYNDKLVHEYLNQKTKIGA